MGEDDTPVVATEFVGTSISSGDRGNPAPRNSKAQMAENPRVKFHNTQRGHVRCTGTPGAQIA